jgi:peptidase E
MNQERIPSKYKVGFSKHYGRVAIIDKNTNEAIETFADNTPEELLLQRMMELREDELLRARLVEGTSLQGTVAGNLFVPPSIEERSVEDGGLII